MTSVNEAVGVGYGRVIEGGHAIFHFNWCFRRCSNEAEYFGAIEQLNSLFFPTKYKRRLITCINSTILTNNK